MATEDQTDFFEPPPPPRDTAAFKVRFAEGSYAGHLEQKTEAQFQEGMRELIERAAEAAERQAEHRAEAAATAAAESTGGRTV